MLIDRPRFVATTTTFIVAAALVNATLYHVPLFSFAAEDVDIFSFTGSLTVATLLVVVLCLSITTLALVSLLSYRLLKAACIATAVGNAIAAYFVVTYHAVLDKTMMGNVLNTNFLEVSELLHPILLAYVLFLGILPCWFLLRLQIQPSSRLRVATMGLGTLLLTAIWVYLASGTWLWIAKNEKRLGGMLMPWSYVVNSARYSAPALWAAPEPTHLPPATFTSNERTVVVLVIGEAARAQNFELYGYGRPTNPRLSKAGVIALKNATACSTYTTASLRCILTNAGSEFGKRYEPLPSYVHRYGIDVIWRSHNWGEPPITVSSYEKAGDLRAGCTGTGCDYDEVMLTGLQQRIEHSASRKVLVVLHQAGSHGPAYSTKYPPGFETFTPVCASVNVSKCSRQELLNAYDNTILYADYVLAQTIALLTAMQDTATLLIYVSDHGESLGEFGLYLHGMPYSIAPAVQKQIPFVIWMSEAFARQRGVVPGRVKSQSAHTQQDVFHTVMGAFGMESDAYLPAHDIFNERFGQP